WHLRADLLRGIDFRLGPRGVGQHMGALCPSRLHEHVVGPLLCISKCLGRMVPVHVAAGDSTLRDPGNLSQTPAEDSYELDKPVARLSCKVQQIPDAFETRSFAFRLHRCRILNGFENRSALRLQLMEQGIALKSPIAGFLSGIAIRQQLGRETTFLLIGDWQHTTVTRKQLGTRVRWTRTLP